MRVALRGRLFYLSIFMEITSERQNSDHHWNLL